MKLEQAHEQFMLSMQGVLKPATINWYQTKLKPLLSEYGDVDIEQITIDDLRIMRADLSKRNVLYPDSDYRPAIKGKLSSETIRNHVRATRRLFNWCVEEKYLEHNPSTRLRMPPKKKYPRMGISDSDRLAMLDVTKDKPRDHAILWFVWETACRRAGVASVKLSNIKLDEGEAIVVEKGKSRTVYFDKKAKPLRDYLKIHPGGSYVFIGRVGPLKVSGIYNVFANAAEAAEVTTRWSPHQWRHARSRHWLKNGMPLKQVSQLLGHSSIEVTSAHYSELAQADIKAAHEKYS